MYYLSEYVLDTGILVFFVFWFVVSHFYTIKRKNFQASFISLKVIFSKNSSSFDKIYLWCHYKIFEIFILLYYLKIFILVI